MELTKGYKRSEVGVVPEDWDVGPLSDFWNVTDCKHVTADFVATGFPVASIREVQSRFVDLTNAKQTTAKYYDLLTQDGRKPKTGDLILSRNATVGEIAQVAEWHPLFAMGQDVCLLRKKCPEASSDFLQAVFGSSIIANQLTDLMVGSTFKRVNVGQIKKFYLPMPCPSEQSRIGMALSDVDSLLDVVSKLIAKKRDLKQAAMQQLLTGQTRLPGFSGEWIEGPLREFAELSRTGISPSTTPELHFVHFSLPAFDASREPVIEFGASIESNKFVVPSDAVLVSKLNPRIPRIWAPASIPPNSVCSTEFLVLKPLSHIDRNFLRYILSSPAFCSQMELHAVGTTGSHQRVQPNKAMEVEVKVPMDGAEQRGIASLLDDLETELATLEQRLAKTRDLKQAMMQELLTGRTRLVAAEEMVCA